MIKRKINVLVVCICLLILLIISLFYLYPEKDVNLDFARREINSSSNKEYYNTNTITMLKETGIDTNAYEEITDSIWLDENFEYNEEKSHCTNGSSVSWNSETKQVAVEANRPDSCYVYFDKIS